ncbi:MAG: RagB/SusD family nutrient uptake outer membrane protein [Sphingobacteriales bacterium]|nr:MAG: RagB/SusD family nutrient uptake outer membrane protein [Sphingobacteriales bacterium]
MKNGHNQVDGNYLDAASDDAVSSAPASIVEILSTGGYNSFSFPTAANLYSSDRNYYQGIRRATEFINNIEVVPVKAQFNGFSEKYVWKSEARFLRAYYYFELVKRYGGVPLLYNKLYTIEDDLNVPRSSFEDCINFVVSECDAIKDSLLVGPLNGSNSHRVSRAAALALKAQALLYAASPLYNGGNIDADNPLTGYVGNEDPNRWVLAANAAKEVLSQANYDTVANKTIFTSIGNNEIIFMRASEFSTSIETNNGPIGFAAAAGFGRTSPTQELVDAFPDKNGVAINAAGTLYNSGAPYLDRDPRLGVTVMYNGYAWLNANIQTFEGGLNKPNVPSTVQTRTGYYMRKFMGDFAANNSYSNHPADWVIYRYTQVLLDYIEAQNEVTGPTAEIYNLLFKLRKRGGIPEGTNRQYGLVVTSDKAVLREIIRNERRIELAFEGHRFFDIRRWKIANDVMNQPRGGMTIVRDGDNYTFTPTDVLQTQFINPKMYFYPIPDAEVRKNSAIGLANQNPGW